LQKYYTINNSNDAAISLIYFSIFYFSLFILYISHFDFFYENILLSNFFSFLILQIIDGLIFKNPLLNFLAFFVFWILIFLLIKKNTLNLIKVFSFVKKIVNKNEVKKSKEIIEDFNYGILILNVEKESETPNLIFDETLNDFLIKKYLKTKQDIDYKKVKEENIKEETQPIRNEYLIIKENINFTENLKNCFVKNYSKLDNKELSDIHSIANNENFQKKNFTFFPHKSSINYKDRFNYEDIDQSNYNHLERSNKFLMKNDSYFNNKENEKIVYKNSEHDLNNIRNTLNLSFIKLFLLNNKKFLQILFEIEYFNITISSELYEKYKIIVNILDCLNRYNKQFEKEYIDKINKLNENNKIDKINTKYFNKFKSMINQSKSDKSNLFDDIFNQRDEVLNCNNSNANRDLIDSANIRLKSTPIIDGLNELRKPEKIKISKLINGNQSISDIFENLEKNENLYDDLYKELKAFLNLLSEAIENKNNFIFIGNIVHKDLENNNNDMVLSINLNICQKTKNFILTMINTTDIVKTQEKISELKFKNLYLKKFSHEFKNPLLNIKEICTHFYKTFESYLNEYISQDYKNHNTFCDSHYSSKSNSPTTGIQNKSSIKSFKKKRKMNSYNKNNVNNKKKRLNSYNCTITKKSYISNFQNENQFQNKDSKTNVWKYNRTISDKTKQLMKFLTKKTEMKTESFFFNIDKNEFLEEFSNIKNIKYITEYLLIDDNRFRINHRIG